VSHLSLLGVGVAAVLVIACTRPRWRLGAGVALALLAFAPIWLATRPLDGPRLWRGGGATVLVAREGDRGDDVLAALRAAGVRRLDAVVMERGSAAARALDPVLARFPPRVVLSAPGTVARVGPFVVTVREGGRATVAPWPPRPSSTS
jgi:hypothetical protein